MNFNVERTDLNSKARAGRLSTAHGEILTPIFMPVGTVGSVKAVQQRELLQDIQAQIILGNTYHLYLRPGLEIMQELGGLHQFIHWDKPMLTDSGGYQVYSLAQMRKITEEGVTFKSHLDGSKHFFSPERVMEIQRIIGADIIMAFDECPPYPSEYKYAKDSMDLTHRWLQRCIKYLETSKALYGHEQVLFPIVQGSVFKDLRTESANFIAAQDGFGNAIGGLAVGEPAEKMYETIELVNGILPATKPRYLMGVGTPENILEAIGLGVDMFDCVMPTRNGRNGMLFTTQGIINIKNKKWEKDPSPIDKTLGGYVSTYFSKAYVHHLFKASEILGLQIASVQNLSLYLHIVGQARKQILAENYNQWKKQMIPQLMQRL